MKSQNTKRRKVNGGAVHPQVMLNKLHFDFRNAKLLDVSFCKFDIIGTEPDVQQSEVCCNKSVGQVECNQASGAGDAAEVCNVSRSVARTAVQVDDGDSDTLVGISEAQFPSYSAVNISELTDKNSSLQSFTTECTQSTDSGRLLASCSIRENSSLPPSDTACSSCTTSSPCQLESSKQTVSYHHKKKARKPNRAGNTVAENKTAVRVAHTTVLEPSSVLVKEQCSHKENMKLAFQTTGHNTVGSSESVGLSESSLLSSNAPVLFDDQPDDVSLTKRKPVQFAGEVRKSLRSRNSRNTHSLHNVAVASINREHKCQDKKPKVIRTPKRRPKIKCDSEDECWSMEKKLLIIPVGKRSTKSGHNRKRETGTRRDIFALMPKRKKPKSVSVKGMELPDLSTTSVYGTDSTDISDMLKIYGQESDMDVNAMSAGTSRKWCVDVTGADLMTDFDINYKPVTGDSDQQNASQHIPQDETDNEYCYTDFANSQETPPPSIASDVSSHDKTAGSVSSNSEEEGQELANSQRLNIDTKLAHYIDGRCFDRLVNGVSVRVAGTLTDETIAHIGQECLCLAKLTKCEVKELQDQVRLEEIYHRRAKKGTLSPRDVRKRSVRRNRSRQRNLSDVVPRSRSTDNTCRVIEDDAVNDQPYSSAAESDNDTVSYMSSDDGHKAAEPPKSPNYEREGVYTSELLKTKVTEDLQGAHDEHINVDEAKPHESATGGILLRIRRQIAADKNQSLVPDDHCEPPLVSDGLSAQVSAPSKCTDSETVAVSDFVVADDFHKDIVQQKSMKNVSSLSKRNNFHHADDQPAANGMQYTTLESAAARTDMTLTGASNFEDNEYAAAVALASLSVANEGQLHSICQSLSSEPETLTETTPIPCETEKHEFNEGDTHIEDIAKPAHEFSTRYSTKQSSAIEHVMESSVKPSTEISSKPRVTDGERRVKHVKQHKRISKPVTNSVNERKRDSSKSQKSRNQKSRSANADCNWKSAADSKEKSAKTYLSQPTVNSDGSSSFAVTSKVDKNNGGTASVLFPISNSCVMIGETKHEKRRSGNHRSGDKSVVDRHKHKRVAHSSLTSKQTSINPSHRHTDVTAVSVSDMPARKEYALPLDDSVLTFVTVNSTNSSVFYTSLANQLAVSSPSSSSLSSGSHIPVCSEDTVECCDEKFSNAEAKNSLNPQEISVITSSFVSENSELKLQTDHSEVIGSAAATDSEVYSDLNSNNVSKRDILPSDASHCRQHDGTDVTRVMSSDAHTDSALSALPPVPDSQIVTRSCSLAGSNDGIVCTKATNPLQLSLTITESPTSPYRETEDIRSPSPIPLDLENDVRAEEIRSPSPCNVESPVALFRTIETSWDVKLLSPCEIQSPDVSGDEAEEFSRRPMTIPLTIEEASRTTQTTAGHDPDFDFHC